MRLFCCGRYVGEWYDKSLNATGNNYTLPSSIQKENASDALFATAGVYAGFIVISGICITAGRKKRA